MLRRAWLSALTNQRPPSLGFCTQRANSESPVATMNPPRPLDGFPAETVDPSSTAPPVRGFGLRPGDLDLDLDPNGSDGHRPSRVTEVLAACCEDTECPFPIRWEEAWSLPLGARIARLLEVVRLTEGQDALAATLRCPEARCLQEFEVSLPYDAILGQARQSAPPDNLVRFPLAGGTAALRLPTGRDQSAWQRELGQQAEDSKALVSVVRSLLVTEADPVPELDSATLAAAAAAMESADPLVAFRISTACPHCRADLDLPVDLEAVALARLALARRAILRDVHALATRYGWTESEVLALPSGRRAEYRRLIAIEEDTWR